MKKTLSLLLAGILAFSSLLLPVCTAETLPEEGGEAYDALAQEQPELSEEPLSEAEESAPAEEKKVNYSTIKSYLTVNTGTAAYWDAELTKDAGFFTKSGNLYAQAVSENVWRATFFDSTSQVTRTVYLPMDQVKVLPSAAVTALMTAMRQSGLVTENGTPIFSLSFYMSPLDVTVRPAAQPAESEEAGEEASEEAAQSEAEEAAEDETEEPAEEEAEEPAEQEAQEPAADETEEPAVSEAEEPVVEETEEPVLEVDETAEADWTAAPTDLTANLTDDGTAVILTWTGNSAAKFTRVYELLGDSGNFLADVEGAESFITGPMTPGEHTFFLKTSDGESFGLESEYVTITVPAAWKKAPTGLDGVLSQDGTAVVLFWVGNGAAASYRVYEMLPNSTKARALGNADEADTFTTKTLEPGEHTFLVRAREGEEYGEFSETFTITVPAHWMASPADLTAELNEDGAAVLTWTGNGLAAAYRVYEMIEGTNKARALGTATETDTFTTGALEPGEHTFRVRAQDGDAFGLFSEPVTIVVPEE